MCNGCNSNRSGGYNGGCGYTCDYATQVNATANVSPFSQRLCRDSNGNIRVINYANNSCCHCCHCCHCGCGCGCGCGGNNNGNDAATGNNTNGNGYGCVTICGASANATANATGTANTTASVGSCDDYYTRQYGLNGRNNNHSRCGCGCGGWIF